MKRFIMRSVVALLFVCVSLMGSKAWVKAAANPTKLVIEPNTIYSDYDVTGDGRADTFQIQAGKSGDIDLYTGFDVMVNGKSSLSTNRYSYDIKSVLYTLDNGTPCLFLYNPSEDGDASICGVYLYKSGKFKKAIDCNTFYGKAGKVGYHSSASVKRGKGNSLDISISLMSFELGQFSTTYTYIYKNGTFKCKSHTSNVFSISGAASKKLTARKSMTVYSGTDCKKTAYTLKKGGKVKVTAIYGNSNKTLLQVKGLSNGKRGWIKFTTKCPSDNLTPFKETRYEG